MRYSFDWGVYEIQDEEVVSSFFLPGRPYNVQKEPTRYRVLAQYRPAGDEPFCQNPPGFGEENGWAITCAWTRRGSSITSTARRT